MNLLFLAVVKSKLRWPQGARSFGFGHWALKDGAGIDGDADEVSQHLERRLPIDAILEPLLTGSKDACLEYVGGRRDSDSIPDGRSYFFKLGYQVLFGEREEFIDFLQQQD